MTLALLITAASGAWADETLLLTIESIDNPSFTSGSKTFDDKVTVTYSSSVYYSSSYGWYGIGSIASLLTVAGINGYTITSCKFYTVAGIAETGYTVEGESPSVYLSGAGVYIDDSKSLKIGEPGLMKIEVYVDAAASSDVEVTTNAAEEGATFTEATFNMPAYDATAEYELVRDMTVDVAGEMADRIRIQMVDNAYQAVDATQMNPVVNDNLETNSPVTLTVTTDYTLQLQKQSETNADEWTDVTAYSVGYFRYKITGAGNYSGVIYTAPFQLFEGYEVTVPAGEYVTFYKNENLYVEDEDAQIYTITSVGTETATATELTVAKANMPILVKNNGQEKKVILLLPTVDDADEVTAAKEFVGTLVATTIPASTSEVNNYAFNGKQFVWVKNAIEVGANRAWLHILTGAQSAPVLNLVFEGEVTGISEMVNGKSVNGQWYDLNGRKLQGVPTKKGVYIMNGRKVVVK